MNVTRDGCLFALQSRAFCYNIAFAIAATIPFFVSYIYKETHNIYYINLLFVLFAVIAIPSCIMTKNYMKKDIINDEVLHATEL